VNDKKTQKNPLSVFSVKNRSPRGAGFCLAMQVFVDLFFSKPHLPNQLMFYHVPQNILIYLPLILERYRAGHFGMLDNVMLATLDDLKIAEPF